jgi:outer membrane autotransporter protein
VTVETILVPVDADNTDVVLVEPPKEAVTTEFVSITGSYTGVDQTNARPGTQFALIYGPHTVDVAKIPENYGNLLPLGVVQNPTQKKVGSALTTILPEPHSRPTTTEQAILVSELYPLAVTELNEVLDSVAGVNADPTFVAVMNTRHFQQTLDERLAIRRAPGGMEAVLKQDRTDRAGAPATWGKILGSYGEGDYLGGSDIGTWGLALGADHDFGNGLIGGVAIGYSNANIATDAGQSSGVQTAEAALYGAWTHGDWFATANVGGSYNWIETNRDVSIGASSFGLSGESEARSYFFGLEAGRTIATTWGTIEPSLGLRYQHLERDGYSEDGSSQLGRKVSSETLDSMQAILGLRIHANEFNGGGLSWHPEFRVAYAHEFGDTDINGTASLLAMPSSSFDVLTKGPGDNIGIAGLRLTGKGKGMDYFVDFQAEARDELVGGQVKFGFTKSF